MTRVHWQLQSLAAGFREDWDSEEHCSVVVGEGEAIRQLGVQAMVQELLGLKLLGCWLNYDPVSMIENHKKGKKKWTLISNELM